MQNQNNNEYYVNGANKCCPVPVEKCIPQTGLSVCGEQAKHEYLCYLESEKCKVEPEPTFSMCDYDPSEIYFMQYRSKRAFYNEWWKENLFKDIYNRKAHRYKKQGDS